MKDILKVMEYRKQIKTLRDEGNALLTKAETEKREVSEDEQKRVDAIDAEIRATDVQIDNYCKVNQISEEELRTYEPQKPAPGDGGNAKSPEEERGAKMSIGEYAIACRNACLPGGRMKDSIETRAVVGMSEGVGAEGGFLLYPEKSQEIMEKIHDAGQIYQRCGKREIGPNSNELLIDMIDENSRADGARWGGVLGYWLAEGATIDYSKLGFGQQKVGLHKVAALVAATDEEIQDVQQLTSKINDIVPKELTFKIEDAICRGDGVKKPQGIFNSDAMVTIAKKGGQAIDTVITENILSMWKAGWGRFNAAWFYNQELEDQLELLVVPIGTAGEMARLFVPPSGDKQYGTIKGRPAIPIEQASAPGDVGDIFLADLSQYILGTKGGVQSAVSIHVEFKTGQTLFRFIVRIGGQSSWKSKLTPYKRKSTSYYQSPFVAIEAR